MVRSELLVDNRFIDSRSSFRLAFRRNVVATGSRHMDFILLFLACARLVEQIVVLKQIILARI